MIKTDTPYIYLKYIQTLHTLNQRKDQGYQTQNWKYWMETGGLKASKGRGL
ncbi:uncharacterized protein PGTG_01452 [Puccinia graminis f. sp. tritici CRL 75-36-700-3]|uniref:Uncharacterized protein n=1 Tax=Puccinia graminis f. sp. tritici (strain CRL 75-36-700-3 / race SCCL) TaxID=418459 RepID=E3JSD4_PUCGT|nr:uncharacterized protein PGTG_01452 [Puccinia graminis f. sp. tritici CRL 75-36-700-3]EFP74859.1 hypothetical protein PGTG_01452 [Puccinia graminis f. sp. tritici CRL 75-36-700-3]